MAARARVRAPAPLPILLFEQVPAHDIPIVATWWRAAARSPSRLGVAESGLAPRVRAAIKEPIKPVVVAGAAVPPADRHRRREWTSRRLPIPIYFPGDAGAT